MRIVAVNGSARKGGNTFTLIEAVLAPLRAAGHETGIIELAGKDVRGCLACGKCIEKKDRRCHGRADFGNEVMERLFAADAIILGSPSYFADVTAEIKALVDRTGYVGRANGGLLARKAGAAVAAERRAGAMHVLDTLTHFFLISDMVVVGSSYWNLGVGRAKGEVAGDAEGMATMARLGENLGWLLGRLAG